MNNISLLNMSCHHKAISNVDLRIVFDTGLGVKKPIIGLYFSVSQ